MNEERRKSIVREEDKELLKEALKEGLREWLEEKYAMFGKWSLHGLMALALAAVVWAIAVSQGWSKGP